MFRTPAFPWMKALLSTIKLCAEMTSFREKSIYSHRNLILTILLGASLIGVFYFWIASNNSSVSNGYEVKVVPATPGALSSTSSYYGLAIPRAGKRITAPEGRQKYYISQGEERLPKIAQTVVDSPSVRVGETQKLEVLAYSSSKIKNVYTVSRLDNKEIKLPLLFVGTEDFGGLNYSRYANSWVVSDTHDALYMTVFFVEDEAGNVNKVEHAWSDPSDTPETKKEAL